MKNYLIKNASVINEGKIIQADILIKNNRIEKVASNISIDFLIEEINAEGLHAMPGVIDDQVHFREPGLTHKATIYSESRAAVAGGVTSFMEMPNTKPPAITHEILEEKYASAEKTSLANYSFFLGTSNDNLDEIKKTDPKKVCGIKIFLGSSTGKLVVDNEKALENIFQYAPTLITTHCEDDPIIEKNTAHYKELFGEAIPIKYHPLIRNEEACFKSSVFAIGLAKKFNSRLHILHISTANELELFSNEIPLSQKRITAEACVHHLWFDASEYEDFGPQIKCNPAIKESHHKKEILKALLDDRIDIIATDHAPHTWDEKYSLTEDGQINYFKSPSGLPLIQHSLNMMFDFFRAGKISLEKIIEKMCHAPAEMYQIEKRGFIREGYFADLVLVDLNKKHFVSKENILYKCGWSPFEGYTFSSSVTHTFVNGNLAFSGEKINETETGRRLVFNR
jgi:dihydroorotase